MSHFYEDKENDVLKETLLDEDAQKAAKSIVGEGRTTLTQSQLRRFFNEFRALEKKVKASGEDGFKKTLPLIKMVNSKAEYASNRQSNKIPEAFTKFLKDNIKQINDKKDFEAFMLHFEAVVGFSKLN